MNNLRTFSNHNITGCFPELTKKKKSKRLYHIIKLRFNSLVPKKTKKKKKKKNCWDILMGMSYQDICY